VIKALKSGKTIGYAPVNSAELGHELKLQHKDAFPRLLEFKVSESGEIFGRFSKTIKEFHVYTQNGEEVDYQLTENQNNKAIFAKFRPEHQYLRFKVNFEDADLVYLNPVVRFNGDVIPIREAKTNFLKTILYRGFAWLLLLLSIYYLWQRNRKTKQ
jgi:hypothetical protein